MSIYLGSLLVDCFDNQHELSDADLAIASHAIKGSFGARFLLLLFKCLPKVLQKEWFDSSDRFVLKLS